MVGTRSTESSGQECDVFVQENTGNNSSHHSIKNNSEVSEDYRSAVFNTLKVVGCASIFGGFIFLIQGTKEGLEYFAAYLLELSLSVDNLFVFITIFQYFLVPEACQKKVLFWGIFGAVVLRGIMIGSGIAIIRLTKWVLLFLGAVLLFSAVKIFRGSEEEEDLQNNFLIKISRKVIGATDEYDGERFFTKVDEPGKCLKWRATPLFLCLVCIELSDIMFAVDSVPACLGVSHSLFVVFSSNIFAIACLRSLFMVLSKAISTLEYLEPAVGLVLLFIGIKLVLEFFDVEIGIVISLGIVLGILGTGVGLSLCKGLSLFKVRKDELQEKIIGKHLSTNIEVL